MSCREECYHTNILSWQRHQKLTVLINSNWSVKSAQALGRFNVLYFAPFLTYAHSRMIGIIRIKSTDRVIDLMAKVLLLRPSYKDWWMSESAKMVKTAFSKIQLISLTAIQWTPLRGYGNIILHSRMIGLLLITSMAPLIDWFYGQGASVKTILQRLMNESIKIVKIAFSKIHLRQFGQTMVLVTAIL